MSEKEREIGEREEGRKEDRKERRHECMKDRVRGGEQGRLRPGVVGDLGLVGRADGRGGNEGGKAKYVERPSYRHMLPVNSLVEDKVGVRGLIEVGREGREGDNLPPS